MKLFLKNQSHYKIKFEFNLPFLNYYNQVKAQKKINYYNKIIGFKL